MPSCDCFQDPGYEFGYPRADAGQVGLGAPDSPADDARQEVAAIGSPDLERAPGVTLAGVLASSLVPRAEEDFGDELVPPGAQKHALAAVVGDNGDLNLKMREYQLAFRKLYLDNAEK